MNTIWTNTTLCCASRVQAPELLMLACSMLSVSSSVLDLCPQQQQQQQQQQPTIVEPVGVRLREGCACFGVQAWLSSIAGPTWLSSWWGCV